MNIKWINRNRMAASVLVGLLATAGPASAWVGRCSGPGWGYGMGPQSAGMALTDEQQEKVDEVRKKYRPQLDELQKEVEAKLSEVAAARADGSTTLARLNALEGDFKQLQRRYWTLLDGANSEAFRAVGVDFGPSFTCGYRGCNQQGHMGPRMAGRHKGCCW